MVKISRNILCAVAAMVAVGCATVESKKIVGPDGTENQLLSCYEVEKCYKKATEVCQGRYKIVNTSSETSGINGDTGTVVKLLVKCE